MVNISIFNWTKLLRILAAKNVHPIMNYHYAEQMKKLPRPEKLRVRNDVDAFIKGCDIDSSMFQELYPLILIIFGKCRREYTSIINEIPQLNDRHGKELSKTTASIIAQLKQVRTICEDIGITIPVDFDRKRIDEIKKQLRILLHGVN